MTTPVTILAVMGGSDCEQIGAGWLAQPANAVSSLAYVGAGLWLLRRAMAPGTDRVLLVAAGTAVAVIGVGSVGYHGPQPDWAYAVHDGSIVALAVVLVGQTVRRLAQRGRTAVAAGAITRQWWRIGALMAAAAAAYATGRTGSPLCRPESLWQPHAAWHVLSAVGLGAGILRFAGGPSASAEAVSQAVVVAGVRRPAGLEP